MAAAEGTAARRAALRLLGEVLGQQRLMSELAGQPWMAALAPEDRARAGRLAAEVLRGLSRADRLLAPHLSRRPPLAVLNALRLGAVELASGGAAHGIVSDLVEIVGQGKRTAGMKGLVNAVLRKVADGAPEAWAALPPPKLPPWLRRPLVEAWGRDGVVAMEAVFAEAPPLDPVGQLLSRQVVVGIHPQFVPDLDPDEHGEDQRPAQQVAQHRRNDIAEDRLSHRPVAFQDKEGGLGRSGNHMGEAILKNCEQVNISFHNDAKITLFNLLFSKI